MPDVPVVVVPDIDAEFQVVGRVKAGVSLMFDASLTTSDLGQLPDGTRYLWSFGDGTTASGLQVKHVFAKGGDYGVSLTVTLPDGTTDTQLTSVGISSGGRPSNGGIHSASSVSVSPALIDAVPGTTVHDKAVAVQTTAVQHTAPALTQAGTIAHQDSAAVPTHSDAAPTDRMMLSDHQIPDSAMHLF